ncbi:hypothetical protein BD311DRAFT_809558 [Dichomitus squalens]|uniref:CBS domain-containing protein n=1 Tax=Dichomitus squalens TaxID=114155 RepID=A0A4Q9MCF4_9APHY|nr:hypothetical protein BD311DRAFT_809558 [Dichomitus squalens]
MTVHDALKEMHVSHYLNLPVVEADGRLVTIIDVLKLTYATLEQSSHSEVHSDNSASVVDDVKQSAFAGYNQQGWCPFDRHSVKLDKLTDLGDMLAATTNVVLADFFLAG